MLRSLFKKRYINYLKELLKYLQYIFNDHFMLVVFLLVGVGGVSYTNYLDHLQAQMILPRIFVFFLFFILIKRNQPTLLIQPADKLFLAPKEKELISLLKRNICYSYIKSLIFVIPFLFLSFPILVQTLKLSILEGIFIFIIFSLLKGLNLYLEMTSFFNIENKRNHLFIHVFTFFSLFTMFFISVKLTLFVDIFVGLYFIIYFHSLDEEMTLNWTAVIEAEEKRMQNIYRLIRMFVDVPTSKGKIYRLKILDPFFKRFSKQKKSAPYYYLFHFVFRNPAYSSLVFLFISLGSLFVLITKQKIIIMILLALFNFLLAYQLTALKDELLFIPQFKIYPISIEEVNEAVVYFIWNILLLTNSIYSIFLIIQYKFIGIVFIILTLLWIYVLKEFYLPKKIANYS